MSFIEKGLADVSRFAENLRLWFEKVEQCDEMMETSV
jgi:hypothetical protein